MHPALDCNGSEGQRYGEVNGKHGGTAAADADLVPNAVSVYAVQGLS